MLQSMCERTMMQIANALFASSRRMKEISEPPTERGQGCTQLNLLRERSNGRGPLCEPLLFLPATNPVVNRSGEALKELSKSIYKKFKQHRLNREPYDRWYNKRRASQERHARLLLVLGRNT